LELEKSSRKLVVDGVITNLPRPYYVRLTMSENQLLDNINAFTHYMPKVVPNAFITISDDLGVVDTLIPSPIDYTTSYDQFGNEYKHENRDQLRSDWGYYQTTKLQGREGGTCRLYIKTSEGEEYTANTSMPHLPEVDNISYIVKVVGKEGHTAVIPRVFFDDPDFEKNYYLFNCNNMFDSTCLSSRPGLPISDENLPSYVNGLSIELTYKGLNTNAWWNPDMSEYYIVFMSSLDKSAYDYFKQLYLYSRNDNGTFNQAPATPPSNISNGALGLFFATSTYSVIKEINYKK
jgi:hypothetical protein